MNVPSCEDILKHRIQVPTPFHIIHLSALPHHDGGMSCPLSLYFFCGMYAGCTLQGGALASISTTTVGGRMWCYNNGVPQSSNIQDWHHGYARGLGSLSRCRVVDSGLQHIAHNRVYVWQARHGPPISIVNWTVPSSYLCISFSCSSRAL